MLAETLAAGEQQRFSSAIRTHLVALVRAGATFTGKLAERPGKEARPEGV